MPPSMRAPRKKFSPNFSPQSIYWAVMPNPTIIFHSGDWTMIPSAFSGAAPAVSPDGRHLVSLVHDSGYFKVRVNGDARLLTATSQPHRTRRQSPPSEAHSRKRVDGVRFLKTRGTLFVWIHGLKADIAQAILRAFLVTP